MNGWIVTWDGTGDDIDRREIVAAYNYRYSAEQVGKMVEQLYVDLIVSSEEEKLKYAKNRKSNPYPANKHRYGQIDCGHNPFLKGRFVKNIRLDGEGYIWDEPDNKK